MFRLIAVTIAALFAIFYVFGDETRRAEEVARDNTLSFDLIKAAYLPEVADTTAPRFYVSTISDADAVQIALEAGAKARTAQKSAPLRGVEVQTAAAETEAAIVDAAAAAPVYWTVTGSQVNLRSGPGTSNAVVGKLDLGAEAEVLADADGWYQIRTADGGTSGWIYGKFLQPG